MIKFSGKQKGVAAIELTIILPFMLLLIFSAAEFGRLLYQYNALNHLTRDALRFAIIDVEAGDTGLITNQSLVEIEPDVEKLLIYGDLASTQEILPNLASANISLSSTNVGFVTISVSYNWQPIFFTALPSFVTSNNRDLSFPLVVNYSMRAL